MSNHDHEDVRSLLGAYALNALDTLELRRVERHLESCGDCSREARLLKESAGELAFLVGVQDRPTPELVDRVLSEIPQQTSVRRWRVRILAASVAAALIVIGLLGTSYLRQTSRNSQLAALVATAGREVRFQPVSGFAGRGALYLSRGKAALVLEHMPAAGRARSYQLWSLRGGVPSSVSVINGHGRVVQIVPWHRGGDAFALTIEPEGGSDRPTTNPILISGT